MPGDVVQPGEIDVLPPPLDGQHEDEDTYEGVNQHLRHSFGSSGQQLLYAFLTGKNLEDCGTETGQKVCKYR